MKKISIVVPTLNSETFVGQTLRSIEEQKYENLEVIVVDGHSSDSTIEIVNSFLSRLDIRMMFCEPKGESNAINQGIKETTGEIVTYLDSDDVYERGCFDLMNLAFSDPRILWAYGKCKIIDSSNEEIRQIVTKAKEIVQKHFSYSTLLCVDYLAQPSVFLTRQLIDEIGEFREDLKYSFEYDYWLRAGKLYSPVFINEYLACWRVHDKSISIQGFLEETDQARDIQRRFSGKNILLNLCQDVVYYGTRLLYSLMNKK